MKPPSCPHVVVAIDALRIHDWESCHDALSVAFGFPDFCGHNANAWVDCLTSLDKPTDGMSKVHAPPGGVVVLRLDHAQDLAVRQPEIYAALIECAAFVNWRRLEVGEGPVLAVSFYE
jgi:Barstar (barnase inhibitor)